jgi:4-hydroxy-2-oxoheptanedioate aldolase
MDGQSFREALRAGRHLYGTAITGATALYTATMRGLGLDWVFIDCEHSPIGRESMSWLCHAYRAAGIVPIVRIPTAEAWLATVAMDAGALGIIAPYMEDPSLVRELVGAVKLRPLKGRRLQELLDGGPGLEARTPPYLRERNKHASLIINVESVPALEQLDELCGVEGLDAVLIGPHDLSVSLDIPEQYDDPRYKDAVLRIIHTARAHGIGAGVHHWLDLEQEIFYIKEGANLVAHSYDLAFAMRLLRDELARVRAEVGDQARAVSDEEVV